MKKRLSFRLWLSVVTLLLIALILFFARGELVYAWGLLERIDFGKLVWVLPFIVIGYMATGEMVFSYLRQKGFVKNINPMTLARISLELNFVNHAFPSGGVSGISYANWRLGKYGVPIGRATMAQFVRYVVGFMAIAVFLAVSVLMVTIDGRVNRWIILMSSTLVFLLVVATLLGAYFLNSASRMHKLAEKITSITNGAASFFARRPRVVLKADSVEKFFNDMHDDFNELKKDKHLLIKPFLWAMLFTASEIAPIWITFQALGMTVNPASILIAYGMATVAGFIVVTPGGTGAYEAIMVSVLALSGIGSGQSIAAIVLYRVIVLLTALLLGYVFYQLTIVKYGRKSDSKIRR